MLDVPLASYVEMCPTDEDRDAKFKQLTVGGLILQENQQY